MLAEKFVNNTSLTSENNWGLHIVDRNVDGMLIKDSSIVSFSYEGVKDLVIPDGIVEICHRVFYCANIDSIEFPSSLTTVNYEAFYNSKIKTVEIPSTISNIQYYVFSNCYNLTDVSIYSQNIGQNMFSSCLSLINVTISTNVEFISYGAFNYCYKLTSIKYLGTIEQWKTIQKDNNWFSDVLTVIHCSDGDIDFFPYQYFNYSSTDGNLIYPNNSAYGGFSVSYIDNTTYKVSTGGEEILYMNYNGFSNRNNLSSVEIPSTVKEFKYGLFTNSDNLANIIFKGTMAQWYAIEIENNYSSEIWCTSYLLENITCIDGNVPAWDYIYYTTNNGSIINPYQLYPFKYFITRNSYDNIYGRGKFDVLSAGHITINNNAFLNCTTLTSMTLPVGMMEIKSSAFSGCTNLTSLTYEGTMAQWKSVIKGNSWCYNTQITYVTCSDGVVYFYDYVNYESTNGNSITPNISLPFGNIEEDINYVIESNTYDSTNKGEYKVKTYGSNITRINENAFNNSYLLKSIILPDNLVMIDKRAFYNCYNMQEITFPLTLTRIGTEAFYQCRDLNKIIIPSSVKNVSTGAFNNCYNLDYVKCESFIPPLIEQLVFNNTDNCPIYVPEDSVNAYKTALNWSNYSSRIQAALSIKLKYVSTDGNVINFNVDAFDYPIAKNTYDSSNDGLVTISNDPIENPITAINDDAFYNCSTLEVIQLPYSVETIGENAFNGCSNMTSIVIPLNTTEIGENAFNNCGSLESIVCKPDVPPTIPEGLFDNTNNCSIYVLEHCVNAYKTAWPTYSSRIKPLVVGDKELWYNTVDKKSVDMVTLMQGISSEIGISNINNVVSNVYDITKDYWILTCQNDITLIGCDADIETESFNALGPIFMGEFTDTELNVNEIVMCNKVTIIGFYAIMELLMSSLMIPASISLLETYAVMAEPLHTINFLGTRAQWLAIEKQTYDDTSWCMSEITAIHCSDGDVEMTTTIPYTTSDSQPVGIEDGAFGNYEVESNTYDASTGGLITVYTGGNPITELGDNAFYDPNE